MKKIELRRIALSNFKGAKAVEFRINGNADFVGENASGKTTLFDAYMWCLFGTGSDGGNIQVCPLDTDNKVIKNLEVKVELEFDVDGRSISIARSQTQKWSVPRGKKQEVFNGYEQQRIINGVPKSVSEFNEALNSICNKDDWYVMTNTKLFMNLPQDVRRKKLIMLAGEMNDIDIARSCGAVNIAIEIEKGKSVDDLLKETRITRNKASIELDDIPGRIDQQEKLRVSDDFSLIEEKIKETEKEIELNKGKLSALVTAEQQNECNILTKELNDTMLAKSELARMYKKDRDASIDKEENEISECKRKVTALNNNMMEYERYNTKGEQRLNELRIKMQNLQERYREINSREFEYTGANCCPTCGAHYPQSKIDELTVKAQDAFNLQKSEELKRITKEAEDVRSEYNSINEKIGENTKKIDECNAEIIKLNSKVEIINERIATIKSNYDYMIENSGELKRYDLKIAEIKDRINSRNNSTNLAEQKEVSESITELERELVLLNRRLASKDINSRIDKLKEELETRRTELVQILADCDKIENEIIMFKKQKIDFVEKKVSSLFGKVKWKMYEKNITNDGEREICQAVIDGVPYELKSNSEKVIARIDIANGISKGVGIGVPVWIDNKECITSKIESIHCQCISLSVQAEKELSLLTY